MSFFQGIDSLPIDPNTGNWKSQSVMELNSSVNNHSAAILANNQSIDDLKVWRVKILE